MKKSNARKPIKLNLEKVRTHNIISKDFADEVYMQIHDDFFGETMILDLWRYVATEKRETTHEVGVDIPASWWQMFKETYFPSFLLRYFPVKHKTVYKHVDFIERFLYPNIKTEKAVKHNDIIVY